MSWPSSTVACQPSSGGTQYHSNTHFPIGKRKQQSVWYRCIAKFPLTFVDWHYSRLQHIP